MHSRIGQEERGIENIEGMSEYKLDDDGNFSVTEQVLNDFKQNGYIIIRLVTCLNCEFSKPRNRFTVIACSMSKVLL